MTTPNTLQVLPCLDSAELAAARQLELDLPRHLAQELGRSAVDAAREGSYVTCDGRRVVWRDAMQAACDGKESIPPEASLSAIAPPPVAQTSIHVTNKTTLGAGRRLVAQGGRPLALNFANGINPGGGFLSGARAQEVVLCRSSALYATLDGDPMYAAHAARDLPDSTDWAIHSPDVPVFRRDDGTTLPEPWLLSTLTCAAPYAPRVGQPRSRELLRQRSTAYSPSHAPAVTASWCSARGAAVLSGTIRTTPHRTSGTPSRHSTRTHSKQSCSLSPTGPWNGVFLDRSATCLLRARHTE
jgi:Uncharacterized protein conserved in bacteria (DUF2263)